ncbi:hypothetical protein AB0J55_01905 [Amycolatopsis sp. NPDC049688]|uniref:hypothetical protein n=1 Tax=Amycolatopsis sp. NPDC049688 TaxID=3154733 RepID=UPI00341A1C18
MRNERDEDETAHVVVHNEAGSAGGPVVQAGTVHGGLHVHEWRRARRADELDDAAEALAHAVSVQWQREEEIRRIHDPLPLPVRWRAAAPSVMDHWANVCGAQFGKAADPLRLAGDLEGIAGVFRRIPSRRLVLLGRMGAGKTVLTMRLTMDLLATRTPAEPVPVIFGLGAWDPAAVSLHRWLESQLVRDYTGMNRVGRFGRSVAAELIESGRILPVLDGFDEIADGLRAEALATLNSCRFPFVVTSRTAEFEAAVATTDVVTRAAVIELCDVGIDDLAAYLPRTARPRTGDRPGATMWDSILAVLREQPAARACVNLTSVLSTPLMVGLVRSIYSDDPAGDPAELLDTEPFATADELEDHLLEVFVPTIYRDRPREPGTELRRWPPDRAHRWLGFLAGRLDRDDTPDVTWWHLADRMPRTGTALAFGLLGGLAGGLLPGPGTTRLVFGPVLMTAFVLWLALKIAGGLPTGLVFGLGTGMMFGIGAGLPAGLLAGFGGVLLDRRRGVPGPLIATLPVRGNLRRAASALTTVTVSGLVAALVIGLATGFAAGLGVGLLSGASVGLATGVAGLMARPADTARAVSPESVLRADRAGVLFLGSLGGALYGASFAIGSGDAMPEVAVFSSAFALVGVLALGLGTAWGGFVIARTWLAATGRFPWRAMTFLADAHRRGVLRQTGTVYQFRHAALQRTLSRHPGAVEPP